MVLVSSAVYGAYDSRNPAVLSRRIVTTLLRKQLLFDGVVITDSLESPAIRGSVTPAARALKARVDMLLPTSEADGTYTFGQLLKAAQNDASLRRSLVERYRRLLVLRMWLCRKSVVI
jgi:beta-N-acetylhexosaminidase